MRYFVRYHYKDKVTGSTVFSNLESVYKFVSNYLVDSNMNNNPLYYSVEDTKNGEMWNTLLFWRTK